MYLIEIKIGDKINKIKVNTPQELGKLIQDNMKLCHYIKILDEKPNNVKVKKREIK